MIYEAVRHTGAYPDIYLKDRQTLSVMLRTGKHDADECWLCIYTRNHPESLRRIRMRREYRDDLFDYFRCEAEYGSVVCYQKYYFEVHHEDAVIYIDRNGARNSIDEEGLFEFLYANRTEVLSIPKWCGGQIFYQIFPERFCNGDRLNDPQETLPWGTAPTRENHMGGDLAGIIQKLDYLSELGIDCVYLNPIFSADFNHKYATSDYFRIDPQFGTEEEFRTLVSMLHTRGIRIVLDGVFNHCGIHFGPFEDLLENQERSAFVPWFYVRQYPVRVDSACYECIGNYQYMPKLNTAEPRVQEFILSVMEYWIREFGIDGWRLDVADEADEGLWLFIRMRLKRLWPDVLLLGETWGNGLQLMSGLQMDSMMNYIFRDAVRDYIARSMIDAVTFDARIQRMLASYPDEMNDVMFDPLDTHDTPRFLRYAGDDVRRLKLGAIVQMTFKGAPAIYYGDETGITGDNDPDCRKCMDWDEDRQDRELLELYRKLIRIRHAEKCIRSGRFASIVRRESLYGFVRYENEDAVYVVLQAADRPAETLLPVLAAGTYRDLLTGQIVESGELTEEVMTEEFNTDMLPFEAVLPLSLGPWEAKILKRED